MRGGAFRGWMVTWLLAAPMVVAAQVLSPEAGLLAWLERMQQAALQQSYIGTMVLSDERGVLRSVRIEHASGLPPELGLRPRTLDPTVRFYRLQLLGQERVAGWIADRLLLRPVDDWRYGYQVWVERASGLVLKVQTLDARGNVVEQAAFEDVRLQPAPAQRDAGGQAVPSAPLADVAQQRRVTVPGFVLLAYHERRLPTSATPVQQWVFSDGLASVSVFAQRREVSVRGVGVAGAAPGLVHGATQTVSRRVGDWSLTAVGEAPAATLAALLQGIEPRH